MTRSTTNEDVRKAVEPVRTYLLAAVGAGDLVAKAVLDAVNKAKDGATQRAEAAQKAAQNLPTDVSSLREKLDPAELRKAVEEYTEAAVKLYRKLAEQGEEAVTKFRSQPQVKQVVDQLEEAIATAQTRAGEAATDARELAEDVLAKVTRKTRSVGEKTARSAEKLATETAEAVSDLGEDVAHEVRSTSRKVANRTAPARKPATTTRTTTTSKTSTTNNKTTK
jgi:heparin binding hemagglutinin HbhA